jgi:hypothetical protein
MRHLRFAAAIALLVVPPSIVSAAASWQPATATTVSAGVASKSTFVIQAYVTLPQSCDMARIRTLEMTSELHRSFIVEQMPPSAPCNQKTVYKCTIVSRTLSLPITHTFDVESKGKTWKVALAMEAPTPVEPMCKKG